MSQLDLSVHADDLFVFETRLPVMAVHVQHANSMTQESVLHLLQEARLQYLAQEGMTEIALDGSIGLLISQASINYHQPAFYGDELSIQIYASRFTKKSRLFSFNYQIIRASDSAVIADAATEHAFYDYQEKRITSAPVAFYWMVHRNLQLIDLAA
jgi:acyl-CoA thioesterase FadM